MKLCSVCDKKIEGTWCKNCKRFVKTYDVSDRIHLNESHDPKKDAGCTYHTPPQTARTTANSGTNPYRSTATQTARTTTSTTATSANRSKAGKIIAIIVVVYVVLALLGSIVPLLMNGVIKDMFSDAWEKEEEEYEVDADIPGIRIPELDVSAAQMFLTNVKPVETEVYEDGGTTYTYSYYDPETIAITDISCDAFHFDFEIDEMDALMERYFWDTEAWYTEEEALPENNYLREYDEEAWAYFETDRYYEFDESLMLSVDYDTASGKLHGILFAADAYETENEDYYAIYHALLQELDPEYEDSKLSLARKIERAAQEAGDEYGEVDASEKVNILVTKDDYGYLIIAFYPL